MTRYYRTAFLAVAFATTAVSFAQTRNSFFDATNSNDISVTTTDGLTWLIVLGPNPWIAYNSNTYNVTDAFGFYVLNDDGDVTATATNQNGWSFTTNNSGPGGIAGWEAANANSGITPGQSISFTFTTLVPTSYDRFGFHFRYDTLWEGTQGNTSFIAMPVPEPGSIAALALGVGGLIRLRRRKR